MMSSTMYLPWLRTGMGAFLPTPGVAPLPADPVLAMKVALKRGGTTDTTHEHSVQLRGPGHVVALDPGVVVREEPPRQAQKITPTTFPHVELREPDLPWRHTPLGDKNGRVPPWIVLICVRVKDGVRVEWDRISKRSVLHIDAALVPHELPDLAESWAWAHVQVSGLGPDNKDPIAHLEKFPDDVIARLVCPRHLRPFTRYLCAIVPAFRAGVEAALGRVPETTDLRPAWPRDNAEPVALPMFHSWGFTTGEGEDFEDLVGRLRYREAPTGLGERPLQLLPSAVAGIAADGPPALLRGALYATAAAPVDKLTPPGVAERLAALWTVQPGEGAGDPVVLPPRYGLGQAADPRSPWFAQLNHHPGHRVGAGLGAEAVLRHQEELVAASWEQLEQARTAAITLRHAQLAAEIGRSQANRIAALPEGDKLQLTARAHTRILDGSGVTIRARLLADGLPDGALIPRMRRLTRGGAPVSRRRPAATGTLAGSLATRILQAPEVMVRAATWTRPNGLGRRQDVAPVQSGKQAPTPTTTPTQPFTVRLRPLDVHVGRLRDRLRGPAAPTLSEQDGLPDALRLMPRFDVPLSRWLVDIDPEVIVPGLGEVADDTVMLLEPNRVFVEAVLAGANDALVRELAWREFPVDARGSAFRVFWDGADGVDALEMKRWTKLLGQHAAPANADNAANAANTANAAVLLRGELFRRYPDLLIYAARRNGDAVITQPPTCFGRLTIDTCYALFASKTAELLADWWIVFEELPHAPRFGLDSPTTKPPTASSLSWSHFAGNAAQVEALEHAPATLPATWGPNAPKTWGRDAGAIAKLTLQHPIRCALRLNELLR